MKKMITSLATLALLTTSAVADENSFYAGAGLGLEMATDLDSGVALILMGGLPIVEKGVAGPGLIAVEGELTYSVVSPSYSYTNFNSSNSVDYTFTTLAAYGVYTYDITEQLFVKGRAGLVYKSVDVSISGYNGSGSTSEIGVAMGAQGGYKINDSLDVVGGLNLVDGTDIIHLTAGVQYHF